MNNPFLANWKTKIIYFGIWIILSVIQMLLFRFDASQNIVSTCLDSLISNGLYLTCILVIWYPVSYYKNILNVPLFLFFHLLLFLLCLVIALGTVLFLLVQFTLSDSYKTFFIQCLPYRILFEALLYVIAVLSYYLIQFFHKTQKQAEEIIMIKKEAEMPEEETLSRIAVKKNKEIRFLSVGEIRYIEANGDYVLIHTPNGRFLKDKTMKYLETHLPADRFVRIHRSFIINIEYLVKMELYEKEMYQVHLQGDVRLKTSSAGYKLLKQKLQ